MLPYKRGLSLQQKIEVIHIYDKFHSASKPPARIYKCSEYYIRNIIRRKEEYLAEWKNTQYVDLILNEWVCRWKQRGNTVSRTDIIATGNIIIKKLKLPEVGTLHWGRRNKLRSYSEQFTKGKIIEHKSLDIDDIIQDLRGILDDMGYREPVTVEKQILKPDEIKQEVDSDKAAEVDANQIHSITDDNCVVEETMNNLKVIKTETIDDVEIVDRAIHPNDNTISELELNQSFFDEIRNEKGTNVAAKTYLDAYDNLSCLEINLLHEADLHGLKLINDLKKHLLTKIVDIRKNK